MGTRTLVSLEEYLSTVYEPDCDYVEGELEERNVGEWNHNQVQGFLYAALLALRQQKGFRVAIEQRIEITPRKYRVPDICVVLGDRPKTQVLNEAPFLCVEVLSPEDRASRVLRKIEEYLRFGVRYVWTIDPEARSGYIYSGTSHAEATDGMLRTSDPLIEISLAEIFRMVDE